MYNKKFFNKHVLNALMSVLLAAGVLLAGCGGPDRDEAGAAAVVGDDTSEISAETTEETETEAEEATEAADEPEEDLPALCYKTDEERWWQGKPLGYPKAKEHRECTYPVYRNENRSNKFFMVNGYTCTPKSGHPDLGENLENGLNMIGDDYVRLTGTLYEIFFYDKPEYDLVYFPGDELPEGYTVKITEGYELIFRDDHGRDGEELDVCSVRCKVSDDGTGVMSYENDRGGAKDATYGTTPEEMRRLIDTDSVYEWDFNPGEYYEFLEEKPVLDIKKTIDLFRVLTKEDMEALPEGVTIDDNVMHY